MSEDLYNLIYNKALDLISRREHSQKEIKNKFNELFQITKEFNTLNLGLNI